MADLYYIDEDYYSPSLGYFEYTADAVSAIASTVTVTCAANKIRDFNASVTAESSISAVCVKTVSAQSIYISAFTPQVICNATSSASTDLTVSASMTTQALRVKSADITLANIVSLSLQGDKISSTTVALSSAASVTTTAIEYESYIATSPTPFYALGQALINTDQTHFGSHSLYLPTATSGAQTASNHTKFNIPTTDSATQATGELGRFSIEFWYYPTANTAGTFDDIVSHYDNGTGEGWFVQRSGTRDIRFRIHDGATGETTTATTVLTLNAWNWVVITRTWTSGNRGELRIAVDGVVDVTDLSNDYSSGTSSKTLYIGDNGSGNGSAVGYIDGLHIQVGVDTSTTATPTSDVLEGTAYSKLLMNWNGTWYDQSASQVEQGVADLTTAVTVSATARRDRTASSALASTANVTVSAVVVSEAAAALTSDSTLASTADRSRQTNVNLTSEFTITCSALDLDFASADLTAAVTLTALGTVTKETGAAFASQASVTAAVNVTGFGSASLTCEGFVVAVGLDLDLAQATLTAQSQLTCGATKTVRSASSLQSSATISATATRIKQFATSVNSAFSFSVSEQKIKDVFISGAIGQVFFRNTPVSPNYDAVIGDKFIRFNSSVSISTSSWALAFWASGQGYVWHDGGGTWILLDDTTVTLHSTNSQVNSPAVKVWSGQDTKALHHYLFYGSDLYIDGVLQTSFTLDTGTFQIESSAFYPGFFGLRSLGAPGANGEMATPQQTYQGSLGQYVLWTPRPSGFTVPNFSLSSERLKLYNSGYVDIGATGESTGLMRPTDYFLFSVYNEFVPAGGDHLNRGSARDEANTQFQYPRSNATWRQVGSSVTQSGNPFNLVANYTPTEQDDVGPFTGVFTVSAQAQTVLVVTANIVSTATVVATASKLTGTVQNLSAVASVSAAGDRIRITSASLVVSGSKLTAAVKTGRTLIDMATVATVSCVSTATFSATATMTASSQVLCAATKTASGVVTAQAVASIATTNTRVRRVDSTLNSAVTVTASAVKTARALTALSSQAVLTGSPFTTYQGAAVFATQFSLQAQGIAQYIAISNQTAVFSQQAAATRIRSGVASLSAFNFVLAIGSKIIFDPFLTLTIQQETRTWQIVGNSMILSISQESRVNTIHAENNALDIESETRLYTA